MPYIEDTTTLNPTKNLRITTKPDLRKRKNVNIFRIICLSLILNFYTNVYLHFISYQKIHDITKAD